MLRLLPGVSSLFLPFRSIHLRFFQILSRLFPMLAVANTGSYEAGRIKQVTLLDAGFRVECPQNMNELKKHDLWYDDL